MPLAPDRVREAYDRMGNALDRMERFESRAKALGLEWLAPQPGESVVELGVGTGRTTVRLLDAVGPAGHVHGFDLSPKMLEITRGRARDGGFEARLDLHEASIEQTGLPDASADAVTSSYVLDLLPEAQIRAAIAEAKRILRPGGRALFVGMTPGRGVLARSLIFLWGLAHALRPVAVGG